MSKCTKCGCTDDQLHILRHSLGLDDAGHGRPYRNHFATGPECDNFQKLQALCELGLMEDRGKISIWGDLNCFIVTDAGRKIAMTPTPQPKMSRSKLRYQAFLKADCGMSFGEWMKAKAKQMKSENYCRTNYNEPTKISDRL